MSQSLTLQKTASCAACFLIFLVLQVDIYAGFLHDAVVLYAHAAHDLLRAGGNLTDGEALIKHMTNRSFQGI